MLTNDEISLMHLVNVPCVIKHMKLVNVSKAPLLEEEINGIALKSAIQSWRTWEDNFSNTN